MIENGGSPKKLRFEPALFSDEAAAVLRSIVRKSEYEWVIRLPRPGGTSWLREPICLTNFLRGGLNCWRSSPLASFYKKLLQRLKGRAPVALFDLFFLNEDVLRQRLDGIADANALRVLQNATIIFLTADRVRAMVRCYPLRGRYFLSDPARKDKDFVYFGRDSHFMVDIAAQYCAGRHFARTLDLCTGSGVQGISLSSSSDEVLCADINPRALAFVAANARLNKVRNVRAVHSDLFSATPGRFDCILANTPYVPEPSGYLPIRGGDLGMEFTLRLLAELPDKMTDKGIAVIYTSDPIVRGEYQLLRHVREQLGNRGMRVVQIPLFRNAYPRTKLIREHYARLDLTGYDDCILVIERAARYEAARRPWDWMFYNRTRLVARVDLWRHPSR